MPTPTPANAQLASTSAADPVAAIQLFYQAVSAHDWTTAAQYWDDHMRAEYPPDANINGRFANTSSIGLASWQVQLNDGQTAVVGVDIRETLSSGQTNRYVGTWTVVKGANGWLLHEPALNPA